METWMGPDGSELDSGCILTTASNDQIGNIHHRMPVVIRPADFERWLDCKTQEPKDVDDLLAPVEDGFFDAIPVGDAVNKVANTGPEIQKRGMASPPASGRSKDTKTKTDSSQMDLF